MSGYIGTRKVPTLTDGGGIWTINEQTKFKKDGIWPLANDPLWSYVTLRLPFNDNLNDVSSFLQSISVSGNVAVSATQSKFGGKSAAFDGSGDYLSITYDQNDFNWNDNNGYAIECWVYASSWSGWSNSGRSYSSLIAQGRVDVESIDWAFGPRSDGKLGFGYWNGAHTYVASTGTLSTDQWVHIAFKHLNGTITLYINGVPDGTAAVSGTPLFSTNALLIGQWNNTSISGYVDDLRITKGADRLIVLPTEAYPVF